MVDLEKLSPVEKEEEAVRLAKRILKVYGRVETPVLDREITRMAKMLSIPIKEVFPHGRRI